VKYLQLSKSFQQHDKKQDVGKKKKPVTSADKVGHALTVETQVITVRPSAFLV